MLCISKHLGKFNNLSLWGLEFFHSLRRSTTIGTKNDKSKVRMVFALQQYCKIQDKIFTNIVSKFNSMKAKMIWANFSVKDTKRTNQFYTQLGFTPSEQNNDELASFLFGDDDFVIHFFEQGSKIDEYISHGANAASEIIFTLSADTEAEVNEFAEKVKKAGGNIFREVHRDENDYYGFAFADPDGHKFNVLLMDKWM
jgi:predicted lactoylglutathione lyase